MLSDLGNNFRRTWFIDAASQSVRNDVARYSLCGETRGHARQEKYVGLLIPILPNTSSSWVVPSLQVVLEKPGLGLNLQAAIRHRLLPMNPGLGC